ncbi:MAG: hypothetical protein CMA85_01760 [Euryarchaeota archaeon]|nr:hypothetical protein [Euryarchaeota archaeon]|tara:strand:- start:341 stop:1885 length:1545 start_codon:yes stop_codon:yes gene_type:complete
MREVTVKSMKLARDLDGMLDEALERDLLIRIGWGRGGDEKPKSGEIGAASHLPADSRVLLLGDLGQCAGAMNNGGTFTLQGSADSMLGAFQRDGRIVVEKDAAERVAHNMSGGVIIVQGSVGDDAGAGMSGGTLIVRGHAGKGVGSGMSGGTIVILGSVGTEPGQGMSGGSIVIAGSCPPPGEGTAMRGIEPEELSEISNHIEPMGLSIEEDALVLVPSGGFPATSVELPEPSVAEGFESIALIPSSSERLPVHTSLDPLTLLMPVGSEEGGLLFPIPWLIEAETAESWQDGVASEQPALVRRSPRACDLLHIDEANLVECSAYLSRCAGIVLDLDGIPTMDDAEIEAILVSLSSKMSEDSLILLRDGVDRVDHLFRLVIDLDLDGAVVDAAAPGGSRAAAALPRIGLAARAMNLTGQGRHLLIEMDEAPGAEDLLISVAAGCSVLVAPPPASGLEESLQWLQSTIRGWMIGLGIDGLEKLNRRNLRALDYDTASISGLRLIGYDRPLPMWLGN